MVYLIIFVVIAVLITGYVSGYNRLIAAAQKVEEGWSGITVQLKRRHELVPNLVAAVRGVMRHEAAMLEQITEARAVAIAALGKGDHADVMQAEGRLSAALNGLLAYAEDYPELKTGENVLLLQRQLEETEDQIAAARRLFNGNVRAYNTRLMSIPWNMIAKLNGFIPEQMFMVEPVEMTKIAEPVALARLQPDEAGQ